MSLQWKEGKENKENTKEKYITTQLNEKTEKDISRQDWQHKKK